MSGLKRRVLVGLASAAAVGAIGGLALLSTGNGVMGAIGASATPTVTLPSSQLHAPYPACNGGDGYSYVHCTGGSIGAD